MTWVQETATGLILSTWAAGLGSVGYLVKSRRRDGELLRASISEATSTLATLKTAADLALLEQKHTNERQAGWNEQTSRGLFKLTDDVELLEDVTSRHSNRLRDDARRLRELERRLDSHDKFNEQLIRQQAIAPLDLSSRNGDPPA